MLVVLAALVFGGVAAVRLSPHDPVSCTVTPMLVNPCRPWLGGWANTYPGHTNTGLKDQILDHERRIGRQLDLVHAYNTPGMVLTPDEKYFVDRPQTTLLLNWKPAYSWAAASGGDPEVNRSIDAMAASIRSMAPHRILLIIWGEPERSVTDGASCISPDAGGRAGTISDYIAMWHNVRARFDRLGVDNVVWGMNYMIFPGGTCNVKALWPGNGYVDWVFADPYVSGGTTYTARMDFTYQWLQDNSDATHDFDGKPWGWAEWGVHQMSQGQAYQAYDEAKADLESDRYPRVKAYVVFDSQGGPNGGGRVGYADNGSPDPIEQAHYNAFADSPAFTDPR